MLPSPIVMLVTDSSRRPAVETSGESWLDDIVREAVLGGVNLVQLREKGLRSGELIALGLHVRDAIAGRASLFVNGDVDAAVALQADGIHLPEADVAVEDVRGRSGGGMLVSRAVHSVAAARHAAREGADLIVAGTVFASASHPGAETIGVEGLRAICAETRVPVVAIGGIDATNAGEAMRAGAAGVAVIGAVFDAEHPRAAAARLRGALEAGGAA